MLTNETGNQEKFVLFLFGDESHDEHVMRTSVYAKLFFHVAENLNSLALVTHYQKRIIPDTKQITYIGMSPWLRRIPLLGPVYQIIVRLRWIRRGKPALVIMTGCPQKQDFRYLYRLLLPRQKYALVMMTPSVSSNRFLRYYVNKSLQFNILFFSTLIAEKYWRHDRLKLPIKKMNVIDPGVHDFGYAPKDFSTLKLVYVGVLRNRGIEQTIEGVAMFIHRHPEVRLSYDIFGKAAKHEVDNLKKLVRERNLGAIVTCHGFLSQEEGSKLIQTCNIGVAYLPTTSYFGNSSAKTLEYLIAGLVVLATPSPFKADFVNDSNGVLHDDNPVAFANALETVYDRRFMFNPEEIRQKHLQYSMSQIVKDQLIPILNSLMR